MSDPLAQLINTPLRPQPLLADRVERPPAARELEPDAYRALAAGQQRWSPPWPGRCGVTTSSAVPCARRS
jgi:hypothetical protein